MKLNHLTKLRGALRSAILWGAMLACAGTVSAQTVVNPSFEADDLVGFPGYRTITGWTGGSGINNASGPFHDNGVIPDGQKIAFIQGAKTMSQMISGLSPGTEYVVSYFENARNGGTANLTVNFGGTTVVALHTVPPVGGTNPYREVVSSGFTATASSHLLEFNVTVSGDATVLLDNVRVTAVSVPPNTPPSITRQPVGGTIGTGDTFTFVGGAVGSQPLFLQWKLNGNNLFGQTNSSLTLSNIEPSMAGNYSLVASNASGMATSSNATLLVRANVPGLFNTGVDSNRVVLADGLVDPHYMLVTNADSASVEAFVHSSTIFPIVAGPWLANNMQSKWIAPRVDSSGSAGANGIFTYRTTFDLTGLDAAAVTISGKWTSDNDGLNILVNGQPTGITQPGNFDTLNDFTINSGNATFLPGTNTLDFVIRNTDATVGYTALRVQNLKGLAPLPGTPPSITGQPTNQIVHVGEQATFAVTAEGSAPLTYQWRSNGVDVAGATNATYRVTPTVRTTPVTYTVRVLNGAGAVVSSGATLTVFDRIPGLFNTGVDGSGVALADGAVDPHYTLITNAHDNSVSQALVQNSTAFPIVAGPWAANTTSSKWIGPLLDTSAGAIGLYVYRTTFTLDDRDPSTVLISGRWASDNTGLQIRVNGRNTGNATSPSFSAYTPFTISSSNATFVSGMNTIDFVVENAPAVGYTGLRVDQLKSDARLIPANTPPTFITAPVNVSARPSGEATFTAVAKGSAPLTYQWFFSGFALSGETGPTLTIQNLEPDQAGEYTVRVTNPTGSIESAPVTLTLLPRLEISITTYNRLRVGGTVGQTYRVEFADDPRSPSYQTLTNLTLTADPTVLIDPSTNAPKRVYRVSPQN